MEINKMAKVNTGWYLQRHGHPDTVYHLSVLLESKNPPNKQLIIGRKPGEDIDIVCDGKTVSRKHCALSFNEDHWEIEDMGSMNGIFLNTKKIDSLKLTRLDLGQMIGIGAMSATNQDYFVFDLLKTVVKEEKQDTSSVYVSDPLVGSSTDEKNCRDDHASAMITPPTEEHLSCVDNSSLITGSEFSDPVELREHVPNTSTLPIEKAKNQASSPKLIAFGGNVMVSSELMLDVKLRPETKCAVTVKKLPESPTAICHPSAAGSSRKRGKRPLRLESDSDDDICPVKKIKLSKKASNPNSVGGSSTEKKGGEKRISSHQETRTLHREVLSSKRASSPSDVTVVDRSRKCGSSKVSDPISLDSSTDESKSSKGNVSHAAPSKTHFVIEKFSSGIVSERRDTSVTTGELNHHSAPSGYSEELDADDESCDLITTENASSKLTAPEVGTNANPHWDGEIIILDSDEETFTSQRIKTEPIDVTEVDESSPMHDQNCDNEDTDMQMSSSVALTSSDEEIFISDKKKPNESALPKTNQNKPSATHLPSLNRTSKTNESVPVHKSDGLQKPKPLPHPRKVLEIPMQSMKSRRSSKKSECSSRPKTSKTQDPLIQQHRKERLKQVSAKDPGPSTSSAGTDNGGEASHSSVKTSKAPVKAKNTKKTRNEKYVEDVMNQGVPLDSQKRGPQTVLDFKIPKKPRTDNGTSAIDPGCDETLNLLPSTNGHEQQDPLNDLDVTDLAPLPSPQFKKPVKRIAHGLPENGPKPTGHKNISSNSNNTSDPVSMHSNPPSRSRDPRKEARPLGQHLAAPSLHISVKSNLKKNDGILSGVVSSGNPSCELPNPSVPDFIAVPTTTLVPSRLDQDDRPYRNASPDKKASRSEREDSLTRYRNASPTSDHEMRVELFPENQGSSSSSTVVEPSRSSPDPVTSSGDVAIVLRNVTSTPNPSDPRINVNRGILNLTGPRSKGNEQKRRVLWANNDQVREIEPRPNRPQRVARHSVPDVQADTARLNPPPPLGPRLDTKAIIDEMLLRIVCWNYNWIAEQRKLAKELTSKPPPLLQEQVVNGRKLPELNTLPVVSSFVNMGAYLGVFYPLMFHELWASVCKESETIQSRTMKVVATCSTNNQQDGPWTFLQCQSLLVEGSFRLWDQDLMVLALPVTDQKTAKLFGIAESVQLRNVGRTGDLDPDLRSTCTNKRPDFILSFVLRVKRFRRYDAMSSRRTLTVAKVTTLKTAVKQFCVNADLTMSPLCNVILRPTDHTHAFELINASISPGNEKLNAKQQTAVRSISDTILRTPKGDPKVALLQGPPGTGKSHVIIQLVIRTLYRYFDKNSGKFPRILICAPSNYAVDEIAHRLMQICKCQTAKFNLLRIGVPAAIHSKVQQITLEHLSELRHRTNVGKRQSPFSNEILTLKEEVASLAMKKQNYTSAIKSANAEGNMDEAKRIARKLEELESQKDKIDKSLNESNDRHLRHFDSYRYEARTQVISEAHVICSTLNSCRNRDMERVFFKERSNDNTENEFLCCIIDEASQCTEPESLSPLALGISKLVLIGDPEQLPATVMSQSQRFDQSLFNRFFSYCNGTDSISAVQMLDTQYRMAPSICQWPSKFFYGRKLLTAPGLARNGPLTDYIVLDLLDSLEEQDTDDGKSVYNVNEARLIALAIKTITQNPAVRTKQIGVITYYQKQKQTIIDKIKEECGKGATYVEVNTVDSFQGQEKDIVILSTVRAKAQGRGNDIGFVSSLQRMNVALTRAKESLIVCTHFPTLQANEAWKDLIDDARERKVAHTLNIENASSLYLRHLLTRSVPNKIDV